MANKTKLSFPFNLRDIKLFSTYEDNSMTQNSNSGPRIVHNIIISCFKNGLLFFQVAARSLDKLNNYMLQNEINWFPFCNSTSTVNPLSSPLNDRDQFNLVGGLDKGYISFRYFNIFINS